MDKPDTSGVQAAQTAQTNALKQQQQEQEQQAFNKFRLAQQTGFGSSAFGTRLTGAGGAQSQTLGK